MTQEAQTIRDLQSELAREHAAKMKIVGEVAGLRSANKRLQGIIQHERAKAAQPEAGAEAAAPMLFIRAAAMR